MSVCVCVCVWGIVCVCVRWWYTQRATFAVLHCKHTNTFIHLSIRLSLSIFEQRVYACIHRPIRRRITERNFILGSFYRRYTVRHSLAFASKIFQLHLHKRTTIPIKVRQIIFICFTTSGTTTIPMLTGFGFNWSNSGYQGSWKQQVCTDSDHCESVRGYFRLKTGYNTTGCPLIYSTVSSHSVM